MKVARPVLASCCTSLIMSPSGLVRNVPYTVTSRDRKSTRLNSSHLGISYAVFCLKKKKAHACLRAWHDGCGDELPLVVRDGGRSRAARAGRVGARRAIVHDADVRCCAHTVGSAL